MRNSGTRKVLERVSQSSFWAPFDALASSVAILNRKGRIVFHNRAWAELVRRCGLSDSAATVGSEYVASCRHIIATSAVRSAEAKIRDVLQGLRAQFQLDSEGQNQQQWYRITATRFERDGELYCVVTHDPIDAAPHIDFEDLLAGFSSSFARANIDEIDGAIEQWLKKIVPALGLDRSSVARFSPDGTLYVTQQWAREGVTPVPIGLNVSATLPWVTGNMACGKTLVVSGDNDVPAEGLKDLLYGRRIGFESNVFIPLKAGDEVIGAIGFASILRQRNWSPKVVQRMSLVAEVFAGAIERQRAISDLLRLQREMREISGAAMMGEMAASLAHELNQPLGSIMNNAQAAQRLLKAPEPRIAEIQAALAGVVEDDQRAVDIIRSVRASFQRGPRQHREIDLRRILIDVERILRPEAASHQITLSLKLPEALPAVSGQRTQLMQVAVNLVINAFDAIRECADGPREITITARYDRLRGVRVIVCDTGKGIEPSILPRLFKAFATTKANGMGMGLAIARSIIEEHGGSIVARQNATRGAALEFVLPVTNGV